MKQFIILIVVVIIVLLFLKKREDDHDDDDKLLKKIIYQSSFFDANTYFQIFTECNKCKDMAYEKSDIATRHISHVSSSSVLCDIFYDPKTIRMIETLILPELGSIKIRPLYSVPIDIRKYTIGGEMDWHRDTILKTEDGYPQLEVVYTVDNTSDSTTEWIDDNDNKHTIKSHENSLMITQGGSVYHHVTPVTTGHRVIIKVAYEIYNDNLFSELSPEVITKDAHRKSVSELLLHIDYVMRKYSLPYWAISSTLLGAFRNSTLLPWYDDADISVTDDVMSTILNMEDTLYNEGLSIRWRPDRYKICWSDDTRDDPYPFVDVFPVHCNGEYLEYLEYSNDISRSQFNNERFRVSDLFHLRDVRFDDGMIMVPHNPYPYLLENFGEWRIRGRTNGYINSTQERVPVYEFDLI